MGKCTICGTVYCSCPGNGICASCAAKKSSGNVNVGPDGMLTGIHPNHNSNCGFTPASIQTLRDACVKALETESYVHIGITKPTMDMYAAYVLIAWQYRHEPCKYVTHLQKIESICKLLSLTGQTA